MPKQNKNFILSKAADNRGQTKIGPRPWTEQPQGCGKPGFAIHMPSSFLTLEEKAPFYKDSWELRTKGKQTHLFRRVFFLLGSSRLVKILKFHEFRFDLGQTLRQLLNLGSF
jgi:hypothetical protein